MNSSSCRSNSTSCEVWPVQIKFIKHLTLSYKRVWIIINSEDMNKEVLMKSEAVHDRSFSLNFTQMIVYQQQSQKKEPEVMFSCPHMPGLLKQSGRTHQHPISPSFIFHRLFGNVSFGLRCLRDGSRPRRRQKVYPLAPRPAVASVAPCSPAPYKSLSKPPIIHHWGKGVIIVPMTPGNPPWTAPLPSSIVEASIQRDEWRGAR